MIATTPYGSYEQLIQINVLEYNYIPIVNLGYVLFLFMLIISFFNIILKLSCKFQYMCRPHLNFQKVNPNSELMIIAECAQDDCLGNVTNYHFSIFKEWVIDSNHQTLWIECNSNQAGLFI